MNPVSMSHRRVRASAAACGVLIAGLAPAPAAAQTTASTPPVVGESLLENTFGPLFANSFKHHHHRFSRHARLSAHGRAIAPEGAPLRIRRLIRAANRITFTPYVWGGGHGSFQASGYDCSGSVSYALHGAGVLGTPEASGALTAYGRPGPGRWVTIYANGGHVYMTVAGLRYDTSAHGVGGSRWTRDQRGGSGYIVRHPAGL